MLSLALLGSLLQPRMAQANSADCQSRFEEHFDFVLTAVPLKDNEERDLDRGKDYLLTMSPGKIARFRDWRLKYILPEKAGQTYTITGVDGDTAEFSPIYAAKGASPEQIDQIASQNLLQYGLIRRSLGLEVFTEAPLFYRAENFKVPMMQLRLEHEVESKDSEDGTEGVLYGYFGSKLFPFPKALQGELGSRFTQQDQISDVGFLDIEAFVPQSNPSVIVIKHLFKKGYRFEIHHKDLFESLIFPTEDYNAVFVNNEELLAVKYSKESSEFIHFEFAKIPAQISSENYHATSPLALGIQSLLRPKKIKDKSSFQRHFFSYFAEEENKLRSQASRIYEISEWGFRPQQR